MQNERASAVADDISLDEYLSLLRRGRRWLIGLPLAAALLALVSVTLTRPQWEATGVIKIGAVGQIGQVGRADPLIEPVARAVERMKLQAFEDLVIARLGYAPGSPEAAFFRDTYKVKALPNTDLIELTVKSFAQEDRESAVARFRERWTRESVQEQRVASSRPVEAAIASLEAIHEGLAAPSIERLRTQLAQTEAQIERVRAERERLSHLAVPEKAGFMERLVATNALISRDAELQALEQTRLNYQEQLGPLRTYPTAKLGDVSVGDRPVAPKKATIVLLAAVFGILLGIAMAFFTNLPHLRAGRK